MASLVYQVNVGFARAREGCCKHISTFAQHAATLR